MDIKTNRIIDLLREENANFKKLAKYTIEDIDDLFWEYDRISSSGQETLDRLAKMYNMRHEPKTKNLFGGDVNAISK